MPYIGRQVDALARERLRAGGTLLIVGDPLSGASRTCFEALRAVWGRAVLLGSEESEPASAELSALWLDDLGSRLPHAPIVDRLDALAHRTRLRIAATITAVDHALWSPLLPELFTRLGPPVRLSRLLAPDEANRAATLLPDRDLSHGIPAALGAPAEALQRWSRTADCPFEPTGIACRLGEAVRRACLELAAMGVAGPIPLDAVRVLALGSGRRVPGRSAAPGRRAPRSSRRR